MGGNFGEGVRAPSERPLVVTPEEGLEMNARVRDILETTDIPHVVTEPDVTVQLERFLTDPRPLALQIIRALRDLHSMAETSILVSEEECWFLERRFRHNDQEPFARTLLKKIHILILEFHSELDPIVQVGEVEEDADKSFEDAIKSANSESESGASEDTGQGTGAVPTE